MMGKSCGNLKWVNNKGTLYERLPAETPILVILPRGGPLERMLQWMVTRRWLG